jgi:hypothetical protein
VEPEYEASAKDLLFWVMAFSVNLTRNSPTSGSRVIRPELVSAGRKARTIIGASVRGRWLPKSAMRTNPRLFSLHLTLERGQHKGIGAYFFQHARSAFLRVIPLLRFQPCACSGQQCDHFVAAFAFWPLW